LVNLFPSGEQVRKRILWFILLTILLIVLNQSVIAGIEENHSPEAGTQKYSSLSSDLLQLLDKSLCPPGMSPDDIMKSMEINHQIRRNDEGDWLVHITIELDDNETSKKILPFLSHPIEDPSYNLISGWVTSDNLSLLGNYVGIRSITPVFPPAGSGSLEVLPDDLTTPDIPGTLWKTKLSTDLLQLLDDSYLSPGQSRADIMALMEKTGEIRIEDREIEVRISAKTKPTTSPSVFEQFFLQPALDSVYGRISGWISAENITNLAMQEGIVSLVVQIPPRTSKIQTEGDYLLMTRDFRNTSGLSGEGICVGVISDGVDGLESLKKIGELPNVTVLSDTIGGDEGLAMLQIVHDIAPNASLYFHDRGSSQIEYVRALDQLIIHGCNIICDDITYVEPFFEDGYIAQNIIDRILSYNILYITAAGNFAKEHYQAPFNGYEEQGYLWQNFNGSKGRDLHFSVSPGLAGHVILQWDDRVGYSSNNYDLFLYDESGREIARSVNLQDGDDDPMEWVRFVNNGDKIKEYTVKVVQAAADEALLEIYVLPLSGRSVIMDPYTTEDSIFGQQAVKQAIVVGAAAPDPKNITVQEYSSRGPVLIRHPAYELRKKPDLVAPDHITVLTGTMQQAVFSGTSAAAPHIAGLAALIWSVNPNFKESDVRRILLNATNTEEESWNATYGLGIPRASNLTIPNSTHNMHWLPLINGCSFEPRTNDPVEKITVYPGWNMISIPFPLKLGSTARIFEVINTVHHTIWRFNAAKGSWNAVKPDDTLLQMDVVWIYSADETSLNLEFDTTSVNQTMKQLHPGWNPVGVPGRESITARELLSPLTDAWTYVLVFDAKTQEFRPSIINGGAGTYSPSRLLYPSEGWWIYMTRPGILFPVC
jgi:hypothetical protein